MSPAFLVRAKPLKSCKNEKTFPILFKLGHIRLFGSLFAVFLAYKSIIEVKKVEYFK